MEVIRTVVAQGIEMAQGIKMGVRDNSEELGPISSTLGFSSISLENSDVFLIICDILLVCATFLQVDYT